MTTMTLTTVTAAGRCGARLLDRLLNTPGVILLGALPGICLALYALATWPALCTGLVAGWCGAWALVPLTGDAALQPMAIAPRKKT